MIFNFFFLAAASSNIITYLSRYYYLWNYGWVIGM